MTIQTTLSGSFPKLPLESGQQNVRVVRNRMGNSTRGIEGVESVKPSFLICELVCPFLRCLPGERFFLRGVLREGKCEHQ